MTDGPRIAVVTFPGSNDDGDAALALEFLGAKRCVPCHWGTFPALTGTPAELRELTDVEIVDMAPGDTITV